MSTKSTFPSKNTVIFPSGRQVEAFIFNKHTIDTHWLGTFSELLVADHAWLQKCAEAVQRCYQSNPNVKDGYARIGRGILHHGIVEDAKSWYDMDWILNRISNEEMAYLIELELHLEGEPSARGLVQEWYVSNPEARNGYYWMSTYYRRNGDSARARYYLMKDWESGHLQVAAHRDGGGSCVVDCNVTRFAPWAEACNN